MAYVWIPPSFTIALTADGIFRLTLFWTLAAMMIFLTAFVHVVLDRLAAAEAGAKTVAFEMKHRVQNNLALVQAIVRQTFQNSDTLSEAQILLTDRLAALGRAHDAEFRREEHQAAELGPQSVGAFRRSAVRRCGFIIYHHPARLRLVPHAPDP